MTILLVLVVFGLAAGALWAISEWRAPYRIDRDDSEIRDLWREWRR